jgi:hypothetical protein
LGHVLGVLQVPPLARGVRSNDYLYVVLVGSRKDQLGGEVEGQVGWKYGVNDLLMLYENILGSQSFRSMVYVRFVVPFVNNIGYGMIELNLGFSFLSIQLLGLGAFSFQNVFLLEGILGRYAGDVKNYLSTTICSPLIS